MRHVLARSCRFAAPHSSPSLSRSLPAVISTRADGITRGPAMALDRGAMLNFLSYQNRTASPAAPLLFVLFVTLQLLLLWVFIRFAFRATWEQQVAAGARAIALTGIVCSLCLCFAE